MRNYLECLLDWNHQWSKHSLNQLLNLINVVACTSQNPLLLQKRLECWCIDRTIRMYWLAAQVSRSLFFLFLVHLRVVCLSVLVSCVAVMLHIRSRTVGHVVVLQLCVAAGCDRPPGVGLISRIKASIQIRGRKQRPSVCSKLHEHRTLPGAGWVCGWWAVSFPWLDSCRLITSRPDISTAPEILAQAQTILFGSSFCRKCHILPVKIKINTSSLQSWSGKCSKSEQSPLISAERHTMVACRRNPDHIMLFKSKHSR